MVNLLAQIPSIRLSETGQAYPSYHFSLMYPNAFVSTINKSSFTIQKKKKVKIKTDFDSLLSFTLRPFLWVAQRLKHLPAMWETSVRSLSWEDPLEKKIATHSSILAWRIPWTEDPGGLQSMGSQKTWIQLSD